MNTVKVYGHKYEMPNGWLWEDNIQWQTSGSIESDNTAIITLPVPLDIGMRIAFEWDYEAYPNPRFIVIAQVDPDNYVEVTYRKTTFEIYVIPRDKIRGMVNKKNCLEVIEGSQCQTDG